MSIWRGCLAFVKFSVRTLILSACALWRETGKLNNLGGHKFDANRVLIVDDSRAQRCLLAAMLRRAGYDVVEAASAEEALPICADPTINLVISDWGMPGLDGPDFCRALRQMDRGYIYFILVTSRDDRQERAEGLDSGADDFVTRPIDWVELRARLRAGRRLVDLHRRMAAQKNVIESTLSELQSLHTALQTDLSEARKLQQSLIPPPSQLFEHCSIASRLVTCGQIGGDLVGHFPLSDTKLAVFSIDVSGHGIASALMTGRLSGLFSSHERDRNIAYSSGPDGLMRLDPPHHVVDRLNRLMLAELDTDIYFTCVLAYLDFSSGSVELCQAGHPHPMIVRADGTIAMVGEGGPPVGLVEGLDYTLTEFSLKRGERLILYSDGLSEAVNSKGQMLGETGMQKMLSLSHSKSNLDALVLLEEQLHDFAEGCKFEDDISMLSLELTA